MKINVWNTILQLSKERGVEPAVIIRAVEESLRVASASYFTHGEKVEIIFAPEKGELRVYALKKVAENPQHPASEISVEDAKRIDPMSAPGQDLVIDLPPDTLGRITAQAAKQVIFQKVRDAEQENIYEEFAPRLGEIITGVVRRVENNVLTLEVNKTEVSFPLREKLPNEEFERGARVKAVIVQVQRGPRGPQIVVSRTSSRFLGRLLELEIPEIANGQIEIKDIVREPGERSKVAVAAKERDIDPVGACIGPKGSRILAVSKELQGEKIDIIEWSASPGPYAKSALSPARVDQVAPVDQEGRVLEAIVPEDQLKLAIGKKGINVRLASKLVGWRIVIKPRSGSDRSEKDE
jgi:transcription termination/antitermination protein NusA